MTSAIKLTDVSVIRSESVLLDRVDWKVREGERWIVLGPNGAGKTTLMQIASATTFPSSGEAKILGQVLGTVDLFELRTRIGHTSLTVADRLPPAESVRDAVLSAAHGVTGRWREQYDEMDTAQADQIIGELGIAHLAGRTFGTLSEGERKRVLIARALMTDPEMIVLDEPAAGLDLGAREDLVASLANLASDDAAPVLVLVTHHVEEIPPGFTHVLMLRQGAVVAEGPIPSTLTAANLTRTFGTDLELTVADGRYSARRVRYGRRAARREE
ncbi:ABC transporter ATP-binding protein [Aeromicrobium alkaliterrae]|uniref:ABC transporter ATP-binding protein n=1 Tax=Aeromicrobium alkaliterrae TaxID=302168 RepID=A0ABN2JLP6_9ACTN